MNTCACLGPMYGEPYCYCQMKDMKLPLNTVAREEANKESKEELNKLFGPDGTYYKMREENE